MGPQRDGMPATRPSGGAGDDAANVEGLYGADTEHDRRVRARLAELSAAAGMEPGAVLAQLNACVARGESPGSSEAVPPRRAVITPEPARVPIVVARRAADHVWGVTTITGDDPPAVRERPCGGVEPCPWRRDAPLGQFPPAAFELSAPTSAPGSTRRFGCHSSTPSHPRICAGWLLRGADGNPRIRELLRTGRLSPPELPDGMELYDSYTEMAVANGVDPGHPALYPPARPPEEADLHPLADPPHDGGACDP
ncbi:DUF6283 family protein [Embleya scabrispora]|uniref:DUF6283 family protein n=1 Tax=Embleya scabrispora TaxID=159449 RepID=UPI00117C2973|nr:DUF6283 family protein [Embleya scabrispora]